MIYAIHPTTIATMKEIIDQYESDRDDLEKDELDGIASDCVDIFREIIRRKK